MSTVIRCDRDVLPINEPVNVTALNCDVKDYLNFDMFDPTGNQTVFALGMAAPDGSFGPFTVVITSVGTVRFELRSRNIAGNGHVTGPWKIDAELEIEAVDPYA